MEKNRDKKIGLIVIAALLVVLIAGGTMLYNTLLDTMEPQQQEVAAATEAPAVTLAPTAQEEATAAPQKQAEVAGPQPKENLAPVFTVYDDAGNEKNLIDLRGKPAVINFFASWCGPCQVEMPYFEEMYKTYGDRVEFMMVDLCAYGNDTKEAAKKLVADGGWTFPVYFDTEGSAVNAYLVRSMPTTIFVSADGELMYKQIGMILKDTLKLQIDALLAQ